MRKSMISNEHNLVSRRKFLKLGIGAVSALAALEVGSAGLIFLKPRKGEEQSDGVVLVGSIDKYPPGSVTEFADGRFFLVRSNDGGFLAVYRRCPHLGCIVNWKADEERFYCPCHASSFDIHGNFENAPVSRALDIFDLDIKDSQVFVDTSQVLHRDQFSTDQLRYA